MVNRASTRAMGHKDQTSPYRVDIQGMRAIAVLAVVVFHSTDVLPGGFLGVDVFFVISGYVITTLMERRLYQGKFRLSTFALARFRRLAPALALMTAITLVVSPLLTSPFQAQENLAYTALGSTFWVGNFVIPQVSGGYFDAPSISNPLLQTWSLSAEEQLYLVFALLLVLILKFSGETTRRKLWIVLICLLSVASFALAVTFSRVSHEGLETLLFGFYGPLGRIWEFGAGAAVALAGRRLTCASKMRGLAAATGLVTILVSLGIAPAQGTVPGIGSLAPVMGTVLLLWAGQEQNPISGLLTIRPLTFIGDRSYSIYLWHWPLIVWAAMVTDQAGALPIAALLSLGPALASYRYLEDPLRRRALWTPRETGALVAFAIGLPTALVLGLLYTSRASYGNQALAQMRAVLSQPHLSNYTECYAEPLFQGPSGRCTFNPELAGAPMYLIGDSNADHLSEAVVEAGSILGRPVSIAYKNNCSVIQPEFVSSDSGSCMAFVSQVFANLETRAPGTVLLSISDTYPFGKNTDQQEVNDALARFALDLKVRGHDLVLIRSVPKWTGGYGYDPSMISLLDFLRGTWRIDAPASELAQQGQSLWIAFQTLEQKGLAEIFDPWPALCPGGTCSVVRDGDLIYSDAVHITVAQSIKFGNSLAAILAR